MRSIMTVMLVYDKHRGANRSEPLIHSHGPRMPVDAAMASSLNHTSHGLKAPQNPGLGSIMGIRLRHLKLAHAQYKRRNQVIT